MMHESFKALQLVWYTASLIALLQHLLTVCRSMSTICHQFIYRHPLFPLNTKVPLKDRVCESKGC